MAMIKNEEVQRKLKELDMYTGKIDGLAGPLTQDGIRSFQRYHGLEVTGKLSQPVLDAMFPKLPKRADRTITTENRQWPKQKDVPTYYGTRGENQVYFYPPFEMRYAGNLNIKITRFMCHDKVVPSLQRVFADILKHYPTDKVRMDTGIGIFGGCLNVRRMRGGTSWSMHSWGIAIDFDPARNALTMTKARARLAKPDCAAFWEAWAAEGWVSLGQARDYDWMHVQAANL